MIRCWLDHREGNWLMLLILLATLLAVPVYGQAPPAKAPSKSPATSADTSAVNKRIESYLRMLYAWGPSFKLTMGPLEPAPVSGFYKVDVKVSFGDESDTLTVYVSSDGRHLLRGELDDMSADPFAAARARIRTAGNPSRGPSNAAVTVVEFSDFQCPTCRQLHNVLREVVPNYPQVRFVFKDFPLTQIHPWAMTAAIAARCVYQQSPDAFWRVHDAIYDNQDAITVQNARSRMLDFAQQAGVNVEAVRSCMATPEAAKAVNDNFVEGQALKVANTPTVFINGRRLIGANRDLLLQYIQYELSQAPARKP